MNLSYRTENYQLVRPVLENGLAALQLALNEIQVELFASKEQHLMQLYCSRNLNNAYRFYWKLMGLCYANPPFSQLAKVITKIALEGARVVLCGPDWGTTGGSACEATEELCEGLKQGDEGARLLFVFFLRLRKYGQTRCSVEKAIAAEGKRWAGAFIC